MSHAPPAPPEPDAEERRRRAATLQEGAHPGDQPGPARAAAAGRVPGRRRRPTTGSGPAVHDCRRCRRGRTHPTARERAMATTKQTGRHATPSQVLTRKDFVSDQEVRWCPGCGDYSILAQTQKVMPELGVPQGEHRLHLRHRLLQPVPVLHEHVRLPQHPRPRADDRDRAEAARPELSVWVVTGDGDALSIGGNHFMHVDPPQRRPEDPPVQQPDLRPDQGPVLADVASWARRRSRRRWARSTAR